MGPISDTGIGGSGNSDRRGIGRCSEMLDCTGDPSVGAFSEVMAGGMAEERGGELWDIQCSL